MPRGLGFPDAVTIRSGPARGPAAIYGDGDEDEYPVDDATYRGPEVRAPRIAYPDIPPGGGVDTDTDKDTGARFPGAGRRLVQGVQGADSWELWKDWNTNPSGHGGRRGPPVFVKAQGYDLAATEVDIAVDEGVVVGDTKDGSVEKMGGAGVADWYLSLLKSDTSKSKEEDTSSGAKSPPRAPALTTAASTVPRSAIHTASTVNSSIPSISKPKPSSRPPARHPSSSDWFIQRALANKSATTPNTRSSTPTSIAALVNVDGTAKRPPPAPRFHYAIGPDNAGYARLEALGWAGGGLGRPAGWAGDVFERPAWSAPESRASPAPDPDVVDLTADSDSESPTDTLAPELSGPGRVTPVATSLKLDRRGLGLGNATRKVTHTVAEIERARRRARGTKRPAAEDMGKKEKIKWKERDRRDREARARIAAALN